MRRKQRQLIAREFWSSAGDRTQFPCELEAPVLWALPVAILKLPRLSIFDVETWLAMRGIQFRFQTSNRPLHGSLLAYQGRGCILLNGADSDSELRYSLAHETAHFLMNYLRPRRRAVNLLGSAILEVFDGFRTPTVRERVHGILGRIPIGFHVHFMGSNIGSKLDSNAIMELEDNADLLALEIIAPEEEVRRGVARVWNRDHNCSRLEVALTLLVKQFGLPRNVAEGYARYLFPLERNSSVREWLRQREK